MGVDLLRRDDGRRVRLSPAAAGLDAGRVDAAARRDGGRVGARAVPVDVAWRTPQFWLLWAVLCLNVSAGIGVLGMASPMIQEIFQGRVTRVGGGRLRRAAQPVQHRRPHLLGVALRSDRAQGHLRGVLRARHRCSTRSCRPPARPAACRCSSRIFCVILTMYGGGFATIPAYLADLFGVGYVSAIHGRLLTAWSTAGILGPVLVNYIREFQIGRGVPAADAYTFTMYILAGFLVVGLVCNLAIRPVPDRLFGAPVTAKPVSSGMPGTAGVSTVDARTRGSVEHRRRRVGARRDAVGVGCAENADAREPDVPLRRSRRSGCFQRRRGHSRQPGNTGDQEGRRSGGPRACRIECAVGLDAAAPLPERRQARKTS